MMKQQPEIGEIYTRKNGKKYEVQEAVNSYGYGYKDTPCSFLDKNHCNKVLCLLPSIIYIRRKDLESK